VTRELERIQTYYGKVRAAEAPQGGAGECCGDEDKNDDDDDDGGDG
jgi:hypothetical protein